MAEDGTMMHVIWCCPYFQPQREEQDKELADIPIGYLLPCIQRGIAPAMKLDGNATFWGQNLEDDISEAHKKLLGKSSYLEQGAQNAKDQEARDQAKELTKEAKALGLNARQTMLKHKGAFGSGAPAKFPNEEEIEDFMARHGLTEPVETYGDGSLTTPTLWWAALGGYGIWIPTGQQLLARRKACMGEPSVRPEARRGKN